jgi:hypothetical protein
VIPPGNWYDSWRLATSACRGTPIGCDGIALSSGTVHQIKRVIPVGKQMKMAHRVKRGRFTFSPIDERALLVPLMVPPAECILSAVRGMKTVPATSH